MSVGNTVQGTGDFGGDGKGDLETGELKSSELDGG